MMRNNRMMTNRCKLKRQVPAKSIFSRTVPYSKKILQAALILCLSSGIQGSAQASIEDPSNYNDGDLVLTTGATYSYYPAQSKTSFDMPDFSWDTIPRWRYYSNPNPANQADVVACAEVDMLMIEKNTLLGMDYNEQGSADFAARVKAINPDIKIMFYWNATIDYGDYLVQQDGVYDRDTFSSPLSWGTLRGLHLGDPVVREWWIESALSFLDIPNIDGLFFDRIAGADARDMVASLYNRMPSDKFVIGNSGLDFDAWRENMANMDGSYREAWKSPGHGQSSADPFTVMIQLLREASLKGKMVNITGVSDTEAETLFTVAVFLMGAGEYSYISVNPIFSDLLSRPLGAPLGPPIKNGYEYTRSFEHLDLWVNVETQETVYDWKLDVPEVTFAGSDNWTSTVILDNNDGAANTSVWRVNAADQLELVTSNYDDIEQIAFIRDDTTLAVGQEAQLKMDIPNTGNRNLGLYVGGTAPTFDVRQDYISIYSSSISDIVMTHGFDGTSVFSSTPFADAAGADTFFIARTAENTFEVGFYVGSTRTVVVTRNPSTANSADYVGIYADVRKNGTLGAINSFRIVPVGWVVDDFSGVNALDHWEGTVILDHNDGAANTLTLQANNDDQLELVTSDYDGIEQIALIRSDTTLAVGQEARLKMDLPNTGNRNLGLYVGGTAPAFDVREDYMTIYSSLNSDTVMTHGYDGSSQFSVNPHANASGADTLFAARTSTNAFELGFYVGATRSVVVTRNPSTANSADYVGVFVDTRANGTIGSIDSFQIVPVGAFVESLFVEAEDYTGMSGIATQPTTDADGGLNVGWIRTGDWMDYEVSIPSSGTYTVNYRVASLNGGSSVQFQVDGSAQATTSIASTGGWQEWTTLSTSVSLLSGPQTIRLYSTSGGWNINWFELIMN
ncbi:carbohydrate-binding protein [Coraliomargarita algicola]|uniref:Carbohydrate-binding protein n=1 Tax=Coraliomargarita algicola TaxID=3092156 RepID=A0ABZ0RQL0_9BACT|nr:carbohydrate-binding protein [Coraliomargarita sp. J2-16]WPJ97270.1 carbohydrate-binding protein [Coraliomargarita sp. J2-16]